MRDGDCAVATFGKALNGEGRTIEQAIGTGIDRVWYEIEVFPLHRDGEVVGAVHIARDITARKAQHRELRHFKEELNGFEACRRIRSEPWGKDMLVVAVTGWGQEEDRRRTAEAGFDAHFTKPVDFASVMALIGQRRSVRAH